MENKKLFLLDAYALIYRAYYALIRNPRITSYGMNTSAIFGFCNTLEDLIKKENPGYLAVCFDPLHGHTFRHEMYPEYKAQREKQPEDITIAIPYIKRMLDAYNIPMVEEDGYEADDVIGTLALTAAAQGFTTYMMTPDKDYGQLVRDNVFQYRPALGGVGFEIRGPKQICDRYGVSSPEQVIDLLALEGDASDNVPGCPGVGEKTAVKLISQFGSVENLIENADQLKGSLKDKVKNNVDQILFSKTLVTIKTDVPLNISIDSLRRQKPNYGKLAALFTELEFRSFLAKLPKQDDLFSSADTPFLSADEDEKVLCFPKHELVNSDIAVSEIVPILTTQPALGISVYAPGDNAMSATIRSLAIASADHIYYIELSDFAEQARSTMQLLAPIFNGNTTIVCNDVKSLIVLLKRLNINLTAPYFSPAVANYLLASEDRHTLPAMAHAYLHYDTKDYGLTDAERRRSDITIADLASEYAAVALALKPVLENKLNEASLTKLFNEIEQPFTAVLADMEYEGVRLDSAVLHSIAHTLKTRLNALLQKAYSLAGTAFNVNSPSQVGDILFNRLKIDPNARKTKTGSWSTTEDVLEKYAANSPIVSVILDIRSLRKLLVTYVEALPQLINPTTGKIHTTFNQVTTATGRISSANPNLQNIPVRTDEGREIRRAFVADQGDIILSADYSQIELRLMADFSNDPDMVADFLHGEDIHKATAAKIFRVPIAEVTPAQRRSAKTANFGIIYGISAFGLAERLGIPRYAAKELIQSYFITYPGVKRYIDTTIANAHSSGYVTTAFGRKRTLPDINSRNTSLRAFAERNAINAPLQGTAADIIKLAMINISRRLKTDGYRSKMILQVHDELIFNVKPDELERLTAMVTAEMTAAYHGHVPLEVSAGSGPDWLSAH